jgi:1,4-alpha-glucan branching enzyme
MPRFSHDVMSNLAAMTRDDLHLFREGTHCRLHDKLGAHLEKHHGDSGVRFSVWAPEARQVFVMGGFNGWSKSLHPLSPEGQSGIWSGFVPGIGHGAVYKYHLVSRHGKYVVDKLDPLGFRQEAAPRTASLVWDLQYEWGDANWMQSRGRSQAPDRPISVYEAHLGSWRRVPEEGNRWLTYREAASKLASYVKHQGFTHVEFLPLMHHPFYGSWGYQICGYFAPSAHYGSPQDLMFLIDVLHQQGLGVILDWVPSHFPTDEHGLAFFDGSHLFEHADRRQGFNPVWNSLVFDYGRPEVRSFLLSSAIFWLDYYHADGLRVDGVASMLHRDHSLPTGSWLPNQHGGGENREAVSFLRQLNQTLSRECEGAQTWAEESSSWPGVTRPVDQEGLGFGFKWDMGWMHDTLQYLGHASQDRARHHRQLSFRSLYAFKENFILPLSHDEVANGHGSLLAKMPGDEWQKFANLRLLLAYQWALPGKKLLFMGGEFGQWNEWNHDTSLDWHLVQEGNRHNGLQKLVGWLNWLYRTEPALHDGDAVPGGFEWVDADDAAQSTLCFLRKSVHTHDLILAAFNFTPTPRYNVRVGVTRGGYWREILNTDAHEYGGSGQGNQGGAEAAPFGWHGKSHSIHITLPPLGAVLFKGQPVPT